MKIPRVSPGVQRFFTVALAAFMTWGFTVVFKGWMNDPAQTLGAAVGRVALAAGLTYCLWLLLYSKPRTDKNAER